MPIKIPDHLPACSTLEAEGVMVLRETDAVRQDIRPLRIGLLNLMPNKIRTETQIARLIGASPLQVELSLIRITNHVARNTPTEHMISFYRPWEEVQNERFDGFIITGAPVERMPFEDVNYWDEMRRVFDWSQTHVHRNLNICWAAQAAVYHFHGMPKYDLSAKAFGVFRHHNLAPASPYLRGFSDDFSIPVSRWTEIRREDIPSGHGIRVLAESEETGVCLLDDPKRRALHMFNHVEYDSTSLAEEYARDVAANSEILVPRNYFPHDDPHRPPENRWRSHAHLLFGNWINEIYQTTPFDATQIGSRSAEDSLIETPA
ncbi:homoserine O-acetyltransferase MetA [Bryobacter aggregatus]|uniref:homoserine O-acetyltransferase MetA n=1 Tax=Bryobacter aggregatus TaxID=360054 RepID=UPI00055B0511|nr:homoserine O-succinyltransferase [Bryobacter aggregatus]